MKKALIVGIDNYLNISDLTGCVNDAHDVANVLARNADGILNFDVKVMTVLSPAIVCIMSQLIGSHLNQYDFPSSIESPFENV